MQINGIHGHQLDFYGGERAAALPPRPPPTLRGEGEPPDCGVLALLGRTLRLFVFVPPRKIIFGLKGVAIRVEDL